MILKVPFYIWKKLLREILVVFIWPGYTASCCSSHSCLIFFKGRPNYFTFIEKFTCFFEVNMTFKPQFLFRFRSHFHLLYIFSSTQLSKSFFCMISYRRLTNCCQFSSLMSVTVRPTRGQHAPVASIFLQRKLSQLSGQGVPACPIFHLRLIATVEIFCAYKTIVLLWTILIL
jgi:hypothetical protein